ncbi:MAG: S8 family serine peptidase [Thermoanaerobaculia bacterium]
MAEPLTIREKVEKVIDEGEGALRSVIVRMRSADEGREPTLRTAAYRMLQRSLSQSARDILPSEVEPAPKVAAKKEAEEKRFGLSQLRGTSRQQQMAYGRRSIRPLLKCEAVSRHEQNPVRGAIAEFLTAKSVLLELTPDELSQVAAAPGVRDIYPNRHLRLPRVIEAKSLPANVRDNKVSAWGITAIGALSVWGAFNARGKGAKVGVLDTGIDAAHPDLKGKLAGWAEFDLNGDPVAGSKPHDTDRHGTHVSGTIVGGNASGLWIGAAPEAQVSVALVLDGEKGGSDAQVLAGIDWAFLDQKVDVINMSLGGLTLGPEVPSIYTEAILSCVEGGVPVVTAIGNEGQETSGSPGNDLFAFAVGATDSEDRVAGFSGGRTQIIHESNFIPPDFLPLPYSKPELSAPGLTIRSAVPGGEWATFNGTSMATPHVAGAIALLLSATKIRNIPPGERAFFIQDLLTGSVEELGEAGQDHRFGFGRLDILRAIGFAKEKGF